MATPFLKAMAEAKVAGKLAYDTIDTKPAVDPNAPGKKLEREKMKGQIEFKNVNFRYPTRPDLHVLKNFSCVFEAGKTTALVGPSGSGKSSIIQLIERFYELETGEILLDGVSTRDIDLRSMRQQIGYVKQEPALLNTSIRENMLFADPSATESDMMEALKKARASEFLFGKDKNGLETQVGTGGNQLSGGQK